MSEYGIIVVDHIEEAEDDKGQVYLKVTDKGGKTRNFKQGRSKLLTNKGHLIKEGVALKLTMGQFTPPGKTDSYPFIQDFEKVDDVFVKEAHERVAATQVNNKDRGVALSYSKDLVCAGKVDLNEMLGYASVCERYITGNVGVSDEQVTGIIMSMLRGNSETVKKTEKLDKPVTRPSSREATPQEPEGVVSNAGDLMKWLSSKGKKYTPSLIRGEMNWGDGIITDEMAKEAYLKNKDRNW